MSPLFGRRREDLTEQQAVEVERLPRLCELGPALDDAVKQADATPLPKLAATLMSELFGSEYHPRGSGGVDIDTIASPLIPDHAPAKAGDPKPPGVAILWSIAAEAVQLLEQHGLIVQDLWYSGQVACLGYRSTRAGRTAVEQGTVEQIVTRQSG